MKHFKKRVYELPLTNKGYQYRQAGMLACIGPAGAYLPPVHMLKQPQKASRLLDRKENTIQAVWGRNTIQS
jgi:hypothetical protein